jgi:hypothetical protein
MLGWIKKAVNTANSDSAAAKAAAAAGKPPTSRGFLGGSKTRARREEEEESDAVDPKDAAKGKEIHRVAFTLVKETQKILKAAREKQTAVPWPGTAELLSLLTGTPLEPVGGSQHSNADSAEPESHAKLVDMVDAALGPGDAHGDLCALLLDGATLTHPSFTKLCVMAGLPSNLVHCLRIMRVIEFETAVEERSISSNSNSSSSSRSVSNASDSAAAVTDDDSEQAVARAAAAALIAATRQQTVLATARITKLLCAMCSDGDAGVGEQIKPHLPGLLSLAVSAYPAGGIHVQTAAMTVVSVLMDAALTSSMVFLLEHNKVMLDVVKELCHLTGLDHEALLLAAAPPPPAPSSGRSRRAALILAKQPSSPLTSKATSQASSQPPSPGTEDDAPLPPELVGACAEQAGMWLTALRATVCMVTRASSLMPALLGDFEAAGGYAAVTHMVYSSSPERLPAMLQQVCLLITAMTVTQPGSSSSSSSSSSSIDMGGDAPTATATNPKAFGVLQSLLLQSTPVLQPLCMSAAAASSGSGGATAAAGWSDADCAMSSCMPSGFQLGAGDALGLAMSDAVMAVARRSVADRLARLKLVGGAEQEDVIAAVLQKDSFRLQVLEAVLHLYTYHCRNYTILEPPYRVLSAFLCAIPYYESAELKSMALKTLEVLCVMFRDVHPRHALHSAATAFSACMDEALTLMAAPPAVTPIGSPARKPPLPPASPPALTSAVTSEDSGASPSVFDAALPPASPTAAAASASSGSSSSTAASIARACALASLLLDDAELVWRMLEKLLEFDEAKYSYMFQTTGLLDGVVEPLLRRALTVTITAPAVVRSAASSAACSPVCSPQSSPKAARIATAVAAAAAAFKSAAASRIGAGASPVSVLLTRVVTLLCRMLARLIARSPAACAQFRELNVHHLLYEIIAQHGAGPAEAALSVLERAAAVHPRGAAPDLSFLLELVQGVGCRAQRWRQAVALLGARGLLCCGHEAVRDVWREACGFEAAVAAISSLDGAFVTLLGAETGSRPATAAASSSQAQCFDVIAAALSTVTAAMSSAGTSAPLPLQGHALNRAYMRREIGYQTLTCCLVNSGVMTSEQHAVAAVNLLFHMVTEKHGDYVTAASCATTIAAATTATAGDGDAQQQQQQPQPAVPPLGATVRNADAVMLLLGVLPSLSEAAGCAAMTALVSVVRAGGYAELQALCAAQVVQRVATDLTQSMLMQQYSKQQQQLTPTASADNSSSLTGSTSGDLLSGDAADTSTTATAGAIVSTAAADATGVISTSLQPKFLELLLVAASHHMSTSDITPLVRSVILPLLLPRRSPQQPFAAAAWRRLDVLTAMAVRGSDSTPFLRLGGDGSSNPSIICHAVQNAAVAQAAWQQQQHHSRRSSTQQHRNSRDDGSAPFAVPVTPQRALAERAWRRERRLA